jgi:hypothetical protein
MIILKRFGILLLGGAIWMGGIEFSKWLGGYEPGERSSIPGICSLVSTAEAVVGRPVSPVSVAGVARRTSRRN